MDSLNQAIEQYRQSRNILKQVGVVLTEKPVHVELAEWLAEQFFNGKRAAKENQKGWDVECKDGKRIQVKAHAKAPTNPSNWTTLSKSHDNVTWLFVVIFDPDLRIQEVFLMEAAEAAKHVNTDNQVVWSKFRTLNKSIDLQPLREKYPFLF